MYRWNTLIYAASKILSLPANHSKLPLFERNFGKKAKAYFYDWRCPIPLRKLLWECFRLMYIWFFLILLTLILWGFVALYGQTLWLVGLLVFLLPTALELYSLFKWRGFKYQALDLEREPDIATLWPGVTTPRSDENKNGLSSKTAAGERRNGSFKKQVISQALTYFFFGLLTILAFLISPSKGLPAILSYDIGETVGNIARWLLAWALVPIFVAALLWAGVLFVVSFKWRLVEQLDETRFRRIQIWNEILYWPALVTVFGASFASVLISMINVGVTHAFLFIVYGLGIVVLLLLLAHHIRSSRH
jgi:hypothetical protein